MGLSRNKVAVPEGAAGTPPFWSGDSHSSIPASNSGQKKEERKTRIRKTRTDEGSSDTPSGFLYYGHLFSMYIEIFDMLTHETVE